MARRKLRNVDERLLLNTIRQGADAGIKNLSTQRVAKATDVTEATIYVHFQTRENLLFHAYQLAVQTLLEDIQPDPAKPTEQALSDLIFAILQRSALNPAQAIYALRYRHYAEETNLPQFFAVRGVFFEAVKRAWNNDPTLNESYPFADWVAHTVFDFAQDSLFVLAYRAAKNEIPVTRSVSKLVAAFLLDGYQRGKKMFLSSLTDEDKAELIRLTADKKFS